MMDDPHTCTSSKEKPVSGKCGLNSNGTLKHLLGCYTFGHVTGIATMEQRLFETLCPCTRGTDPGAKRLFKHYVKLNVLFNLSGHMWSLHFFFMLSVIWKP